MGELWICEGVGEELGVEKSWMKERRGGECGVSLNRRSICDQSEKASVEEEAMTSKDEKTPAQTAKMSMKEDKLEKGLLSHEQLYEQEFAEDYSRPSQFRKLGLVLLNCAMSVIGNIAPMLIRVYYLHGGSLKWMPSWLQSVGFPVLLLPITILYLRDRKAGINGLASPKLMAFSLAIGLITGALSFTYSLGLQLLPVSTSTLILSSSLAFTALFARLIVGEKFTPYSMAAIILMTLGAAVIAMTKNSDRLTSSSSSKYMLGFFVVITTAAVNGFILPLSEYAYAKWSKAVTYSVVLQFMVGTSFTSTIVCAIGMFLNKDFEAIPREASEFGLGMTTYYILLALIAVISPMLTLGSFGLAFCSSSVFSGIFGALMVPLTEIASVIVFDEKFTMEKSLSFVLCVCGFTAYFYGAYKEEKKQEQDYVEAPCK